MNGEAYAALRVWRFPRRAPPAASRAETIDRQDDDDGPRPFEDPSIASRPETRTATPIRAQRADIFSPKHWVARPRRNPAQRRHRGVGARGEVEQRAAHRCF